MNKLNKRKKLIRQHGGRCYYCKQKINARNGTLDHYIPRSKGGGNGNNLVPSCRKCNQSKGAS